MSKIETIPVCGRHRGNTTGATNGSETTYPSEVRAFTPVFSGVPVTRLLVLCHIVYCFVNRCLSICTFLLVIVSSLL